MAPADPAKRACSGGALFIHYCLFVVLLVCVTPGGIGTALAFSCAPDRVDETAVVEYVHDGDTLHFRDGRKLRIVGVDTPELGRDGRSAERFAVAARDGLRELLGPGDEIGLRFDAERQDKYGRLLAHVFLKNGTSVTAWLLERGLGTTLPVPPNLWNLECYRFVERQAEEQRRGIWSLRRYQSSAVDDLSPRASGYRLVSGRIDRVRLDDRALRLEMAERLVISIIRDDLMYFDIESEPDPEYWHGRVVEARGWLARHNGKFHMRIRHPASLRVLE